MNAHYLAGSTATFCFRCSTLFAFARVYACSTLIKNNDASISTRLACVCVHGTHHLFTLMSMTLAENFLILPSSLSFSDAMRWSIALISWAMLSIEINLEPCQIEYLISIISFLLSLVGESY